MVRSSTTTTTTTTTTRARAHDTTRAQQPAHKCNTIRQHCAVRQYQQQLTAHMHAHKSGHVM